MACLGAFVSYVENQTVHVCMNIDTVYIHIHTCDGGITKAREIGPKSSNGTRSDGKVGAGCLLAETDLQACHCVV